VVKQDKYTRSARGQECLVRTPNCSHDKDQTILAHLNGAGMAMKHLNIHACYSCYPCHDWVDHGYAKTHTKAERDLIHLDAIIRTQKKMVADGVLVLESKPPQKKRAVKPRKPIEKRSRIINQRKLQSRGFQKKSDSNDFYFANDKDIND